MQVFSDSHNDACIGLYGSTNPTVQNLSYGIRHRGRWSSRSSGVFGTHSE